MKLAVSKRADEAPGNYHYFLHPVVMDSEWTAKSYAMMGNFIIEVSEDTGLRLLEESRHAMMHQIEIAHLAEKSVDKKDPSIDESGDTEGKEI